MDTPKRVLIREDGPREGFQFEKGPIPTDSKIALIDALSDTGLKDIQIASFVHPDKVPGMADAEAIAAGYRRREGVTYRGLWLNARGLERALATGRIDVRGHLSGVASEPFSKRNTGRTRDEDLAAARAMAALYQRDGIPITTISIMAAFGCNIMGTVPHSCVIETIENLLAIVDDFGGGKPTISLADTMAWANPNSIRSLVGAVRERWPDHELALHLHDTRGLAMANALAGLEMGVVRFDASVAGLGGCPFAKHSGAAGNICTEDLAFMCEELGIETGIDIEALCEAARLAERIVGHPLPGRVKQGGGLAKLRRERALV